jgi:hypothetical protein
MGLFDEPVEEIARGLSRRQLLVRVGGSLAGAMLASAGLDAGKSYAASPGSISLRDLLGRISAQGCDASHSIRALLPNDHPVISIRDVAGRYAGMVNHCIGIQSSFYEQTFDVFYYVSIDASNLTPGGRVRFQLEGMPDLGQILRSDGFYILDTVVAKPDGTAHGEYRIGITAACTLTDPFVQEITLRIIDLATARDTIAGSFRIVRCPR